MVVEWERTFRSITSFLLFSSSAFNGSSFASAALESSVDGADSSAGLFPASVDCHLRPNRAGRYVEGAALGDENVAEQNGDRRTCGAAVRDSERVRDERSSCLRNIFAV